MAVSSFAVLLLLLLTVVSNVLPRVVIPLKNRDELPVMLENMGLKGTGVEINVNSGNYTNYILEKWPSVSKYIVIEAYENKLEEKKNIVRKWSGKVEIFLSNSVETADKFEDGEVDFVYIEKSQEYCVVLEEMKLWWPKIGIGGVMAGNNYLKGSSSINNMTGWNLCNDGSFKTGGVREAVNEFSIEMATVVSVTYGNDTPTWYIQKRRIYSNNVLHNNLYNEVPTIYTYDDGSVAEELLNIWYTMWKDSGWNARILTVETAKEHPDFEEWNTILDDANICCGSRESYIRFLSMSTVKNGGFYADPFVFPLQKKMNNFKKFKGSGAFTSYDGIFLSLLSGSYDEWNRITKQLMVGGIDKNAIYDLRLKRESDPSSLHYDYLIRSAHPILNEHQFMLNICDFKDNIAIRFHGADLGQHRWTKQTLPALVFNWVQLYNTRCLQNEKPVMFTFVQDSTPHDYI